MKTALIAGSTGLVGGEVMRILAASRYYDAIRILSRRPVEPPDARFKTVVVRDFDKLSDHQPELSAGDVFCCLGTTMKKAGSRDNFRKVDLEYPLALADLAIKNGSQKFLLVSAIGANRNSLFFYNRVKGEVEDGLREKPFKSLLIFQPSLLLGEREESRFAEAFSQKVFPLFSAALQGSMRKYRAIKASDVALAMVNAAKMEYEGVHVFDYAKIYDLAHKAGM